MINIIKIKSNKLVRLNGLDESDKEDSLFSVEAEFENEFINDSVKLLDEDSGDTGEDVSEVSDAEISSVRFIISLLYFVFIFFIEK
jgi:hypothetical protein